MEEALAVFSADGRMPGPQCDNPVEGGGLFFFSFPSNLARHPKGSSRLSLCFFFLFCTVRVLARMSPCFDGRALALQATGELLNEGCRTTGALFSATQTSLKGIVHGFYISE